MNEMTEQEAYRRLTTLCAKAEHCAYEMTEKMNRWGLAPDEQQRVIERLTAGRYIDDRRYAEAFVRDKVRYNKWGRRKVEQALWAKRIDEDIIREALDTIDVDEYEAILRPLIAQKRRSTRAESSFELNQKLIRFAVGRGFTMDIIRRCLDTDEY